MNSVYKKIEKNKKPRVQISYEVEDGEQSIKKELPFVVGVVGDYSADSKDSLKNFKDRKFVEINGENFNDVMKKMNPTVKLKVENTLKKDGSELGVELKFNKMDDFTPDNIAKQVKPLNDLLEVRKKLNELLGKADCSEELQESLEKILQSNENIQSISKELNLDTKDAENKTTE